jgi:GNAT superfamily N-acetyltransferase
MIRPLAATDDVGAFDCGDAARNGWLRRRGLDNEAAGFSRTFVLTDAVGIAGFYAMSATGIVRADVPGALRRNAPDPIPALLIGQLAVALRCQRQGIAGHLIVDAFARTVRVSADVGIRLLVVAPGSGDVEAMYQKFGFQAIEGTTPPIMVIALAQIGALLREA